MKILIVFFFCVTHTTLGQDIGTVNGNFLQSLTSISNRQLQIASDFTNLLSQANLNLTIASISLSPYGIQFPSFPTIQNFLSDIQGKLSGASQQLATLPGGVLTFVSNAYLGFLTNMSANSGAQSNITDMNLLYYSMILNPNATACIAKYNDEYNQIYSNAATNFTNLMESQTSTLPTQLSPIIIGLKTAAQSLIDNFGSFLGTAPTADPLTLTVLLNQVLILLTGNSPIIISQIDTALSQFPSLFQQSQQAITTASSQFDGNRISQLLALVQKTVQCLTAAAKST